ncbi:MAG: MHYT domain-containing protein [Pseudomonadota bacterium]
MLPVTYDPLLVATSILVAIMASFTALRLTTGLNALAPAARKPVIAQSAIALGGGIWSMHFVGMLAVELPIGITYDALPTLLSALLAILVTGTGLMLLHFGERTRTRILMAGSIAGFGIVGMHYLGMHAIRGNCIVHYAPAGPAIASVISVATSTAAFYFAYTRRTLKTVAVGGILLGIAISAMHYSAMVFTEFQLVDGPVQLGETTLSSGMLALIVSLAAFVICGLFLLNVVPGTLEAAGTVSEEAGPAPDQEPEPVPVNDGVLAFEPAYRSARDVALSQAFSPRTDADDPSREDRPSRIPYERDNTIRFCSACSIWAVQADGHYTRVINHDGEHFCPWPLSRLEEALASPPFMRTHRSFLVNLDHVAGFRKDGDKGICLVGDDPAKEVPVSRSQLANVRKALDLT